MKSAPSIWCCVRNMLGMLRTIDNGYSLCAKTDFLVKQKVSNCVCSLRRELRVTCGRTTAKQVTLILASLKNSKDANEAGVSESSKTTASRWTAGLRKRQ